MKVWPIITLVGLIYGSSYPTAWVSGEKAIRTRTARP